MAWVQVGGTDVYYQEEGPRDAQAIVFCHGNSSCSDAWYRQFERFRDRYRVIAYDSVNHGRSANSPREEPEPDRADELEGFLAALSLRRPVLAGNSMGGATVIRWATRHPGQAAALVPSGSGVRLPEEDGAAAPPEPRPLPLETLMPPLGDSFTEAFKEKERVLYERYLRVRATATRLEALRHPRRRAPYRGPPLHEAVRAITSPVLVVVGALDRAVAAARRLHSLVPQSEYVEISGAPHNVYYEAADAYNAALEDFLRRKVATPATARA